MAYLAYGEASTSYYQSILLITFTFASIYFNKLFNFISIIRLIMEVRILQSENEIYQKEKLLGQGAFGKAYLVRRKQNNEMLVIKEVSIDHMSQKEREQTIKEAQILRNLNHPLIVKFIQVYATKQNKLKIVMEYAQCGDLSKLINARRNQKKFFEQSQILDWFTQICLAMKHVHDRKILHRDIKGQNIFITKNNTIKLGDFGIARVLNKTQDKARTVVGTPYYLSPEIIENKPYSFKSDIWSMGVLLYEMCALSPPFNANSLQFLALKIVKGSYQQLSGSYSKQLKQLIGQILQIDPNKRPTLHQILKRPFLQERIRKYLSETYRKDEFSHTILHNHKVQISNKLVKVQEKIVDVHKLQSQRINLKQQAAMLKQKMQKKKQAEKREYQQKRRRQQQLYRKKQQEQIRRRQQMAKMKQIQQKKAVQQRKQWVQRQKKKQQQQNKNYQEQQRRRVLQIAQNAKRRQRQQQELMKKKELLARERYQLQRKREMQIDSKKNKVNKQKEENKKIDDLNEFARKQFFENQMIRKRAEERAKQSEMESYQSEPSSYQIQQKPIYTKPSSVNTSQRESREKKPSQYNQLANKRNSQQQYQPSQQQLQNAFVNPNYHKKTPSTHEKNQNNIIKTPTQQQKWSSKPKTQVKQEQNKQKDYEKQRQQMKKDRQQFYKNKQNIQDIETLKVGKWQKRGQSRQKSRQRYKQILNQRQIPIKKQIEADRIRKQKQQVMNFLKQQNNLSTNENEIDDSDDLKLNFNNEGQFNAFRNQLQDILGNINEKMQKLQQLPLAQMPIVEEKIILRDDDAQQFQYSMTGSFQPGILPVQDQNADFDLFSDYSKLEDLRMCFQNKFGTDNFIKIYRALQNQLQNKGLINFDILQLMKTFGKQINTKLILQNLPNLLTLIVMQQKMSF